MATYHIDPTGVDNAGRTGANTAGQQFATLHYACTRATTAGDIIHVNVGEYTENEQSVLVAGVSIVGDGDTSWIHSNVGGSPMLTLNSAAEGTNGNQSISYIKLDGDALTGHSPITINARSNVKVHHCTIVDFSTWGVVFNGGVGWKDNPSGSDVWATGNEFYNNTVSNCAEYVGDEFAGNGWGNLLIGYQQGFKVYNNTITQNSRGSGLDGYCIKFYSYGWNKGLQIYDNTLTTYEMVGQPPVSSWGFAIELWNTIGGFELYGNTIRGCVDLVRTSKSSYSFGAQIHDNVIAWPNLIPENNSGGEVGIRLEYNTDSIYIYKNLIQYASCPIFCNVDSNQNQSDIYVYYNIFNKIGTDLGWISAGIRVVPTDTTGTYDNWNIWNNTIIANSAATDTMYGIQLPPGTTSNINIQNNIIQGFAVSAVHKNNSGSYNTITINNNVFNGNGTDGITGSSSPTNYVNTPNSTDPPPFVSSSDFHLDERLDGVSVGLTSDYDGMSLGNPPDIGAYEFGSATTPGGTTLPGTTLPGTTLPATTLPVTTPVATTPAATTLPGTTLPGTTLPATTYYIDENGSNSNDGSIANPWLTLYYACTQATTPGDIIHVNAGTNHVDQTCYLSEGVSITGEGVTSVLLSSVVGQYTYAIELSSAAEGTDGSQFISFIKMDGDALTATGALIVNARSNVEIHHCTFVDFSDIGVVFNGGVGWKDNPSGTDIWATGNKFYNNLVDNCASYMPAGDNGNGCLGIGYQEGLLVYNNSIFQTSRYDGYDGYCIKYYSEGYNKGLKIYHNTLITNPPAGPQPNMSWGFTIELHHSLGGLELYNNTINGAVDFVISSKGDYPVAMKIYDNTFGYDTMSPPLDGEGDVGIRFERLIEETHIYRNRFKNLKTCLYADLSNIIAGSRYMTDIYMFYNICDSIGTALNNKGWGIRVTVDSLGGVFDNWNIWNNIFIANQDYTTVYGIEIPQSNSTTNISIRNNIIQGFSSAPIHKQNSGTYDSVSIENNIFYGNGNSNNPSGSATYTNYTLSSIKDNPDFVSTSDFHLLLGSPAIDAGLDVGLTTDYSNLPVSNPPEIGVYEYGVSTTLPGTTLPTTTLPATTLPGTTLPATTLPTTTLPGTTLPTTTLPLPLIHFNTPITFVYNGTTRSATAFAYGTGGIGDVLAPAVTLSYAGTLGTTYGPSATGPTDAGNYIVTANFAGNVDYQPTSDTSPFTVSKSTLVIVIAANSRQYNGLRNAGIYYVGISDGLVFGEDVTPGSSDGLFDTKDIGVGKTVTAQTTIMGADIGNYTYNTTASTTATIHTPIEITGDFTVEDKPYDGTNTATVLTRTPTGKITGDTLFLSGGTATFDNANIGVNKTVTLVGATLTGADSGNYTLIGVNHSHASITEALTTLPGTTLPGTTLPGTTLPPTTLPGTTIPATTLPTTTLPGTTFPGTTLPATTLPTTTLPDRRIAPSGWHIPTYADVTALYNYLLPLSLSGGRMSVLLKSIGWVYWEYSEIFADWFLGVDMFEFDARGSGLRSGFTGEFSGFMGVFAFWMEESVSVEDARRSGIENTDGGLPTEEQYDKHYGLSIRLIKDDSINPLTLTDIDGNVYPTIQIGNQVWMAENLRVTHYTNGAIIPNIIPNEEWIADMDGAMCWYNNGLPVTTLPATTLPTTTLPTTTIPGTTLPTTTLPVTTLISTTQAATTLPGTTLPTTTLPTTTLPGTTLPVTTLPATTGAVNTTLPNTTLPATTPLATTLPVTTLPVTTAAPTTTPVPTTTPIITTTPVGTTTPVPTTTPAGTTLAPTTTPALPAAPAWLLLTQEVTGEHITVNWGAVDGVDGYNVYRKPYWDGGSSTWINSYPLSPIFSGPITVTFDDIQLEGGGEPIDGTQLTYKVQSFKDANFGPFTDDTLETSHIHWSAL
jgi:uncharacterized protein (TIGR02145 family)